MNREVKSRIRSVDVMRGFAVLWMVLFQILDFFSVEFYRYDRTWLRFLQFVNWLPIFIFVSGLSVWLMVNKRLRARAGSRKRKILFHGLKRYGSYVFLGLLLSLWCFNSIDFDEILVIIGLHASVTLCVLLVFYGREWVLIPLAFGVCGISFQLKDLFRFQVYPFYLILPLFFLGAFYAKPIVKKNLKKLTLSEFPLLVIIIVLAFLGDSFNYVRDSLGFVVFNLFLIVTSFIILHKLESSRILNLFSYAGRNSLFIYVFHFAVWYKLAVYLDIYRVFDWPCSILLTCLTVVVIFVVAHLKAKVSTYLKEIVLELAFL